MMVSWTSSIDSNPAEKPTFLEKSDNPKFVGELNEVRRCFGALDAVYRETLHRQLVVCCRVAKDLRRLPYEWSEFRQMAWGKIRRPKFSDQSKALRHVLRWVCGPTKEGQQKASFYFRALGPLLDNNLDDAEIAKKIQKHGLRKLAAKHSRNSGSDTSVNLPRKQGKRWLLPVEIYFDQEPHNFPEVQEHMAFVLKGKVMKVGRRLTLLAYRFEEM